MALNKAVPLLYNALASGEMLPKVELKWYRTFVEGKQEHFFTTTLTDVTIVNIDCQMPHCQDPAKADFTQLILMSTLDKAQQAIQHQDTFITHDKSAKKALDDFCLHAADLAFLAGTTQMQALIYNLIARYLSRHDISLWQRARGHALPYQHNQVLFNHHCYIYCLHAQGEAA